MADTFTIRQNDHGETMTSTLTDATGAVVNLTGATVKLVASPIRGGAKIVNAAATITDAVNGKVSYTWQAVDTAVNGEYVATWKVTFSGGAVESFPNAGYVTVYITPDL